MTNQQILELAKTCGYSVNIKTNQWECWEEQLIEFAREIRKNGYEVGYACGYTDGEFSYAYNPVEDDL
jgi:hypothetical protein